MNQETVLPKVLIIEETAEWYQNKEPSNNLTSVISTVLQNMKKKICIYNIMVINLFSS